MSPLEPGKEALIESSRTLENGGRKNWFQDNLQKKYWDSSQKIPQKLHFLRLATWHLKQIASEIHQSFWKEMYCKNVHTHSLTLRVTTILPFKHKIERMSAFFTAWVNKASLLRCVLSVYISQITSDMNVCWLSLMDFSGWNDSPKWIINKYVLLLLNIQNTT